jgi:hypothetical protein
MAQLELQRLSEGKELNEDDVKGILLERPVSDALYILGIPHNQVLSSLRLILLHVNFRLIDFCECILDRDISSMFCSC